MRQPSPMVRNGCGLGEAQQLHALVARLHRHRDFRDQRHAIAVRDHLHDGGETGGTQLAQAAATRVAAKGERLIAQAMAFLEQDQPPRVDVVGGDAGAARQVVAGWRRQQERIVEQRQRLDFGDGRRQRDHHDIERAADQFLDQKAGLGFAQFQFEIGMALLQHRQADAAAHRARPTG